VILAALAAAAAVSVSEPQPLYAIPTTHRLIEGVASDGRTVWVSSVIDRTILACRKRCVPFARLKAPLSPLGMAWDASRRRLWVTADCPPLPGFPKCANGALIGLDRAGRVRVRLSPEGEGFHAGDVSAAAGNVFVGDALTGAIYWLKPRSARLGTLVAPGVGKSAQGSALDPSGKTLIAADYSQGVATVDLSTGKRALLLRDNGKTLRGIDGIVRCGDRYIAVFNGAQPNELVSFTVDGERMKLDDLYSGPALPAPTQLAIRGTRLVIAGDGDWDKALKLAEQPHGRYPIRSLPLAQLCRP
jgi:hypothetical protein